MKLEQLNGNTYQFTIEGELSQELMEDFYQLLLETGERHEKINLLAIINNWPSFHSFKVFGKLAQVKTKAIGKINKYAVVSEKKWMGAFLPMIDFLTFSMQLKHFSKEEYQDAVDWLLTEEKIEVNPEDYFTEVDIEKIRGTRIYQFIIDGKLDAAALHEMYKIIDDLPKGEKIRLLSIIKEIDGIDSAKTFLKGIYLDLKAIGKIDKYAIVADDDWKNWIKVGDFFTPGLEMKGFEEDEREAAIAWLKE